jgi:fructokinase
MSPVIHADLPRFVAFGEALTDLVPLTGAGPDCWRSTCGGAPWNMAMAMSALGTLSAFGGSISAGLFGRTIWQASTDGHLDLRFIQQVPHAPLLAVLESVDPPRYAFIGENSADLQFRPGSLPHGWLSALRWAYFGGISLVREPLASKLLELAQRVKSAGRKICYDPNYRALMNSSYDDTLLRMCRLADVIKVSEEDLRGLFRVADPRVGLAQIGAWNPQAWLLLTRGAGPATLYRGLHEWSALPPSVEVEDAIGAGDAAAAGLVHSLMSEPEAPPERHLAWAVAAGAGACTAAGASPPSEALVATLAARVVAP